MPITSHSEQQAQNIRSFCSLLDPTDLLPGHTIADLYSLRHLCLQSGGIPDAASHSTSTGWLRAQAWRVLLGYLGPEKTEWSKTLDKRRGEYYQFIVDFFPSSESPDPSSQHLPGKINERDGLLDQIYRDLARSRKNAFAFYRQEIPSSKTSPLTPQSQEASQGTERRLPQRHNPLRRLEAINPEYAHFLALERDSKEDRSNGRSAKVHLGSDDDVRALTTPVDEQSQKPFITLQPASPNDIKTTSATAQPSFTDQRWHSLLRILYIYALLNPSVGYVQGMNEVLFVLLYVMGTSAPSPRPDDSDASSSMRYVDDIAGAHAEADAFWCFSSLIGEVREVYDFEGVDHASARLRIHNERSNGSGPGTGGMSALLLSFSLRLRWLDEGLWRAMRDNSLDPRLPYYSLRWLACLISTELSLPSIVRVWDALLAESSNAPDSTTSQTVPKLDFLIDFCSSMLTNIREPILNALSADDEDDAFSGAMDVIQSFPDEDIGPVIELACLTRQRRLAAPLTGDGPPLVDDEEEKRTDLRDRALSAFREWRSTSTPLVPSSITSTPRRTNDHLDDRDVISSASPAARFKRYAEAFQSSDAAASLSKASTNWQAKAMATWTGSRNATPTKDTLLASAKPLNDLGSSFLQKLRASSENVHSPSRGARDGSQQDHPALRWSRESMPPQLPIPDVHDSPPQRDDRAHARLASGFASLNRAVDEDALGTMQQHDEHGNIIGMRSTGASTSSAASADASDQHTPNSSPAPSSLNRFAHLPSLQHAAAAGIRVGGSPAPKVVSSGPKPLLLQNAARPPREHSNNGSVMGDEPMSRIVSSGPMAANVSPRGSAFTRRRGDNASSSAASLRDSAHTITSFGSGVNRSYDSRVDGASPAASHSGDEALDADKLSPLASLPPLPSIEGDEPTGLHQSKATVSALAFGGRKSVEQKASDGSIAKVDHGRVASSADVPLTQQATLKRHVPRRESSTKEAVTDYPGDESPQDAGPDMSKVQHDEVGDDVSLSSRPTSLSRPKGPGSSPSARQSSARFEAPRSAPKPPSATADEAESREQSAVRKYTLTDAPVAVDGEDPTPVVRRGSNSSSRRSSGAYRTRRTLSAAKRDRELGGGVRSSPRMENGNEMLNENEEVFAEANEEARQSFESDKIQDTADGDVTHRRVSRNAANRLAVIAPGQSLAIESGTSVTPSPGPDEGKVFDAEELMYLLRQGDGWQKERAEHLMAQHGVTESQLRGMTSESMPKAAVAADTNATRQLDSHLLGPRPQRKYLHAPSEGQSEGGATSEDEFYDAAGIEGQRTPDTGKDDAERSSYVQDGVEAIGSAMATDGDQTIIHHDGDDL